MLPFFPEKKKISKSEDKIYHPHHLYFRWKSLTFIMFIAKTQKFRACKYVSLYSIPNLKWAGDFRNTLQETGWSSFNDNFLQVYFVKLLFTYKFIYVKIMMDFS